MISWLFDTLIATGCLMALVLLLRRPVTRLFGPGVAYALWALPLIRLILPPLVLPASFAPKMGLTDSVHQSLAGTAPVVTENVVHAQGWGPSDWAVAIWLCGAAALLIWRAWSYGAMRSRLLKGARPMGEASGIRIIETHAVGAPVAFGVFDKVVALPWGFMASPDRRSRNFALEHEFEHHAGRDLAANLVFQPLLALHWFNPIGWLSWRAMRRDQEAACDARVMAGRSSSARAAYGRLIAGYAAGPRLALAAPMACPVLGEKSIVQRLKCLARPEVSSRRRTAGGALLAASALALPLTATISYAEAEVGSAALPTVAAAEHNAAAAAPVDPVQAHPAEPWESPERTSAARPEHAAIVHQSSQQASAAHTHPQVQQVHAASGAAPDRWLPQPPAPPAPPLPPAPPRVAFTISAPSVHLGNHGAEEDCRDHAERMVDHSLTRQDARRAKASFAECTRRVAHAQAAESLRDARIDIEHDDSIPESVRRSMIESFDTKIAELKRRS